MGQRQKDDGLMLVRMPETFAERLNYCRVLLKVHGFINEAESERIKLEIKDGRCVKSRKKVAS